MREQTKKRLNAAYDVAILLLAVASITMTILDICGKVASDNTVFYFADNVILGIFAVDYIVRFILAKGKWDFFKHNLFDLLAIIPFSSIFSFFRFARLFRLAKFARATKLARVVGVFGKLQQKIKRFLHTNGFIYMLYVAAVLITVSSVLISYVEEKPLADALWWSIVTCTTVGYGDISPETGVGRIIAVILMIFGIGLISMLTGAITTFFTSPKKEERSDSLNDIIDSMTDDERKQLEAIAKIIKK